MKHIVSLSGGKDSTAMLLMMAERGMQIDEIRYVDPGMEFPGMDKHIDKLSERFKITKYSFDFEHYLLRHVKTRGKYKGKAGYGWPSPRQRWCTRLKIRLLQTDLPKDAIHYVGIAADEAHRCKDEDDKRYPLVEWGVTESEALQYCYDKGYDWDGLYEEFGRVSCWCCPLQRVGELKTLHDNYPELWERLMDLDERVTEVTSYIESDYQGMFKMPRYYLKDLDERFKREKENGKSI